MNPIRSVRLFDTEFIEMCSYTYWYIIILAWIPCEIYFYMQIPEHNTFAENVLYWVAGAIGWTFTEYMLHRFLFHMEDQWYFPDWPAFWVFHFTIHGIHHAFPQDPGRIVMPPAAGYIFFFTIIGPFFDMFLPEHVRPAFYIGMAHMYTYYDVFHALCHSCNP